MKIWTKIIFIVSFISVFFLKPDIKIYAETDNKILVIESFLEKTEYPQFARLIIIDGLTKTDGLKVDSINGVPGPRSLENRYSNTVLLLPPKDVYILAHFKSKYKAGSSASRIFTLEANKNYLLYVTINSKNWSLELEETNLEDINKQQDKDKKNSWKHRVFNEINTYELAPAVNDVIKIWQDVYQSELDNAKKSFSSKDLFDQIVEDNRASKKKFGR